MSNINSLPRLLIVDDSRMVRAMLVKHIKGYYDYREEADGEAAWHTLLLDQSIKAVISDLTMPILDGYGLLQRIRSSKIARIRDLPVIMISGDEDDDSRRHAKEVGASDFITKGVGFNELMGRLEVLMSGGDLISSVGLIQPEPQEELAPPVVFADEDAQASSELEVVVTSGAITLTEEPDIEPEVIRQEDLAHALGVIPGKIEPPAEFAETALSIVAAQDAGDDFDAIETSKAAAAEAETATAAQVVWANQTKVQETQETETQTTAILAEIPGTTVAPVKDDAQPPLTSLQAATGLYSREYAEAHLAKVFADARTSKKEISVLVLGFDRYLDLCQKHESVQIDQIIAKFSRLLHGKIRSEDALGVFGEAQLIVVSPGTPVRQCLAFALKVREAIEAANISLQGAAVRLTVSIGVANTQSDKRCKDAALLIQTAARRMYRVMAAGGNRVLGPEEIATLRPDMVNLERALAILDMKHPEALASRAVPVAQRLMPLLRYLNNELQLDLPLERIEQRVEDLHKEMNA